jgi:hypothetical protein
MIPHRVKLALLAAACGASASCLDARVRVPVKVAAVGADYQVKPLPKFALTVRKADPVTSESGGVARIDPTRADTPRCVEATEKDASDKEASNFVEREITSLDGKTAFELLPGDYEICSDDGAQIGQTLMEWRVPFRVEEGRWRLARRERDGGWVYPDEDEREGESELVLSKDNQQPHAVAPGANDSPPLRQ